MVSFGSARNLIPNIGEIPRQLIPNEGETLFEYLIALFVTLSEIASVIGVVAFIAALLEVQQVVDFVNNTTIPFITMTQGTTQIHLVPFLVLTGTFVMVPIALIGSFVSDEKEHLVDDAIGIIILNAIALVMVLFIGPQGISAFVSASFLTFAVIYGLVFVLVTIAKVRDR